MLLSNDRGLGRSLGYVGRKQISLLVMLHAALVHKLACEVSLEPLHAIVVQKLPFNEFLRLLHETVAQTLPSKLFLKLCLEMQKLPCEAFHQGNISISI